MAGNAVISPAVSLGSGTIFGSFCLIGCAGDGTMSRKETVFGENCMVRSHTVIYAGNTIGDNLQTGHHVLIREDNTIGRNVSIGTQSCVEHHITIEDDVRIHSAVFVPEFTTLRKGCWIGPGVVLTNAKYPRSSGVKDRLVGPDIGTNAKIGAGTVILPGTVIGSDALIGAGAVVTKDVPAGAVVVGNPAGICGKTRDITYYRTAEQPDRS